MSRSHCCQLLVGLLLSVLMTACESANSLVELQGAFGVFYGGDLRKPAEIAVSSGKLPKLGFRLQAKSVSDESRLVKYRLLRPGQSLSRIKELGSFEWRPDQAHVDHLLTWPEVFRKGYWSLRVVVDERLIIDRSIYLRGAR